MTPQEVKRFFAKVVELPSGCWEYTGARNPDGYGRFWINGKLYQAHRVSYVIHKGEFSGQLCICHTCDNPPCVNPVHLFVGSRKENMQDMVTKNRHGSQQVTHCPRGHAYSGYNCYFRINKEGHKRRYCRTCHNARSRRWSEKKKQQRMQ